MWASEDEKIMFKCHNKVIDELATDVRFLKSSSPPLPGPSDVKSSNRIAAIIYAYTGWPAHMVIAATRQVLDERGELTSGKAIVKIQLPAGEGELGLYWFAIHVPDND